MFGIKSEGYSVFTRYQSLQNVVIQLVAHYENTNNENMTIRGRITILSKSDYDNKILKSIISPRKKYNKP